MSSVKGVVNRNAKTSGKNSTTNTATLNADSKDAVPNKTHEKEKLQPTAEQLRIAKIIDLKPDEEINNKIKQVMQITQKTEDEVVIALHDNALDIALTIEALLEGPQESWSTTGKKKKNRASSVNKKEKDDVIKNGEADGDAEWDETITQAASITAQNNGGFSERRGRGGRGGRGGFTNRPRPTEGGQRFGESRRERENKENEKNLAEDGASGENRNFRSESRGSRRGINGPRYNGRSRGTRMFQNSERGNSGPGGGNNSGFSQPIDTWFNPTAKESKKENWGTFPSPEDWDNEEYTGSLADTKVFTPSGGTESTVVNNDVEVPKPNENAYLEVEDWNDAVQAPNQQAAASNNATSENLAASIANSKTLTPEQSQYLSSLTQESQQKKVVTLPPAAATFNSHPPVEFVSLPFEENSIGPGKKPTLRARIPPPSKIPLSAVEMPPEDSSVNINFLDVSFGAVDLSGDVPQLCDPSQDQNSLPPVVKYDDSVAQKVDSVLTQTEYSTISNQASVQTQRSPQVNQAPQPSTKIGPPPGVPPPADYLTKQNAAVANQYQNINTGQPTSMYNSSVYSNNPQGLSSHTSLYGTTASNIGVNSTNPHIPQLSQSNHSILNANYPQTAAQPQFPSYSYPHSYQASGISYPPIVSAANLASMYTPSTYSNYIHQNLHQTGNTNLSKSTVSLTSTTNSTKESLYDQSQPSNNSLTSSASNPNGNNISGTTSSIGLAQSTLLTTKTTTPTTNKSGVLSGMPPGVAPLVGAQYILSQQGIPGYYHQSHPVMYSEEHLQMVQSRLPHHMTNFYSPDPMYPSVSSSLTGRETAGTGISNVAGYSSLTDSRYARADNNASPVSSTLSQQTGTLAHQQTLLNPPITPSYTYYYGQSVIPANPFQYGTMYPMAPAASATSHGTGATNTMSGYSKTAAAPAGYNNVYETLGSSSVTGSSNDYGSSSKVGVTGQQTSQAQGKTNSSDLAAMYSSKSTLNKVSPYDKQQQSFQSPPPFSVTLNNGGVGGHHSAGSYAPVFISPLPPGNPQPHHIAPLHHQIDMRVQNRQGQELSNGTSNMSRNQSVNPTASKVNVKQNYSQGATPYWNSN
ncbi:PREDICTED: protein lingerer isoform X3 [Diuraphis noxia]|uniref:protein lingerer isoform X3 n=1 Tax=Diuraphis noxia TaxID=143948 RepID=UPI000763B528|nr:PREDICTED: protein lingerer isoform X3 [Diuraphis noxia]